ncbi:MAG: OB-fold nucleic acid binding domain-containing protein [Spirulinaceae cyanobacterium]
MKIVSCKPLGKEPVYDLGLERDHNFLLANGTVASNCFNKSHSTAYAYVTYQTAYLKANYPVEYMTALLTSSSGNQDKVVKYIATCQNMGIEVEPPHINRSQVDFTPVAEKILFGLSAVRNLGQGAIEAILQARKEAKGTFRSLADLCARVDLRVVNRRALEALIYCGAFDSLEPNRNQLIHDLDPLISWAQSRAKEKEMGQFNLFDTLTPKSNSTKDNEISLNSVPQTPRKEDFSPAEKLKQEKELLGFYVSDHPLKSAQKASKILSPINLNQLAEQGKRKKISTIVIVTDIRNIITKKGDPMAFVQIEDISSQAEGVVFPSSYEQVSPFLEVDKPLIMWGRADQQEDKVQLIIEEVEPVETVHMVMVELTPQQANDPSEQVRLKGILNPRNDKKQGKVPVVAIIGSRAEGQFVRLGQEYWVENYQAAVEALNAAHFSARAMALTAS